MKIAAHGLRLVVSPVGTLDEEDWCRVRLVAEVPGFQADLIVHLQGADLRRFRDSINLMYEAIGKPSEAALSSHEPGIEVTLSMQSLGVILGTYKFEGEFLEGGAPGLTGGFAMDQSYLPALSREVDVLLAELGGA
jgi:hypothetical protein